MEIFGVTSKAYTSAAAAAEDEEKLQEGQEEKATEEAKEYGVSAKEKQEKDIAQFATSVYDETDVEDKAVNYLKNIMFTTNLTDESSAALQNYLNTFDVAKFIKNYGPFNSSAEISAAMYAVTAGLVKQQDE
jgi:hypothetical protein